MSRSPLVTCITPLALLMVERERSGRIRQIENDVSWRQLTMVGKISSDVLPSDSNRILVGPIAPLQVGQAPTNKPPQQEFHLLIGDILVVERKLSSYFAHRQLVFDCRIEQGIESSHGLTVQRLGLPHIGTRSAGPVPVLILR